MVAANSVRKRKKLEGVEEAVLLAALGREVALFNKYRLDATDVGMGRAIAAEAECERIGDEIRRRKGRPSIAEERARKDAKRA